MAIPYKDDKTRAVLNLTKKVDFEMIKYNFNLH